jgi:hypothetical protein
MPTQSSVISHLERAAIERGLAIGSNIRQMAKKYNLSIDTLYRYRSQMPPQLRASHLAQKLKGNVDLEKLRIEESEGILTNLATQRARLLLVQDAALEKGDRREVAYIADVIHRNIKLTGTYLGEFAQHQIKTSVSILIQPEYLDFRAGLMRALAPYPQARRAVAQALHEMEAKTAATPSPKAELPLPVIEGEVINA